MTVSFVFSITNLPSDRTPQLRKRHNESFPNTCNIGIPVVAMQELLTKSFEQTGERNSNAQTSSSLGVVTAPLNAYPKRQLKRRHISPPTHPHNNAASTLHPQLPAHLQGHPRPPLQHHPRRPRRQPHPGKRPQEPRHTQPRQQHQCHALEQ